MEGNPPAGHLLWHQSRRPSNVKRAHITDRNDEARGPHLLPEYFFALLGQFARGVGLCRFGLFGRLKSVEKYLLVSSGRTIYIYTERSMQVVEEQKCMERR